MKKTFFIQFYAARFSISVSLMHVNCIKIDRSSFLSLSGAFLLFLRSEHCAGAMVTEAEGWTARDLRAQSDIDDIK